MQTYARVGLPPSNTRTRWRFGSKRRFVATEAASGLQLAGLETGVPIAFGVLTVDTVEQAEERLSKGGEAARAALEMADIFSQVRAQVRAAN